MKLKNYLTKSGIHRNQLAGQLNVTTAAVETWINGKNIPQPRYMRQIVKITKGKVQPNDFYEDMK